MGRHLDLLRQGAKRAPGSEEIERAVQHYLYGERRQVDLLLADRDAADARQRRDKVSPPSSPADTHGHEIGGIPS